MEKKSAVQFGVSIIMPIHSVVIRDEFLKESWNRLFFRGTKEGTDLIILKRIGT